MVEGPLPHCQKVKSSNLPLWIIFPIKYEHTETSKYVSVGHSLESKKSWNIFPSQAQHLSNMYEMGQENKDALTEK